MSHRCYRARGRLRLKLRQLTVELRDSPIPEGSTITTPDQAAAVMTALIGRKDREHVAVLHLCVRRFVVGSEIVSIGDLESAILHPREIFKTAFLANSHSLIVGHNHPSGDLSASLADIHSAAGLYAAGDLLGIELLDFLIVSGDRWTRIERGSNAKAI